MGAVKKIMKQKHLLQIDAFSTESGIHYIGIPIQVSTFGEPLGSAPILVINHGVQKDISEKSHMAFENLAIDSSNITIASLCFPRGMAPEFLYESYKHFNTEDIKALVISAFQLMGHTMSMTIEVVN